VCDWISEVCSSDFFNFFFEATTNKKKTIMRSRSKHKKDKKKKSKDKRKKTKDKKGKHTSSKHSKAKKEPSPSSRKRNSKSSKRKGSFDGGNSRPMTRVAQGRSSSKFSSSSHKKKTKKAPRVKISDLVKHNLGVPPHMSEVVVLHTGNDYNEWVSANTVDFLNEVTIIYCSVMEFCTSLTCATMNAGPKNQYKWIEGAKAKSANKPISLSAPQYVDRFLQWAEGQLADPKILPLTVGPAFPKTHPGIMRNVFKHIFRIYAHIYLNHLGKIIELGIDDYVNSSFKHFIHFAHQFSLVDTQDYSPLKQLIKSIMDPSLEVNSDEDEDEDEDEEEEKEDEKEEEKEERKEKEDEEHNSEDEKEEEEKEKPAEEEMVISDISDDEDLGAKYGNLGYDGNDDDDDDILDD